MMKYFTHTNAGKLKLNFRTKMNLLTTGLIFFLLLLSTFLGNGVMILLIHHGFINAGPPSSQIPLLIQTGIISIIIGTLITLLISHLPLKPLHTLVEAIHQVSTGNYDVKIHLEHPAEFREVSDCFNHMTEELSCTEMLRSDFINNFSHEFKTPIVSVLGFAKLLKSDQLTKDQREEYLDIIIEESRRLSELSTTILDLSRIESLSSLSGQTTFSLSEQIREAILLLEYKWSQKHLKLDLNLEELDILADEALLKQVWINLLDNGIKFSPEFGKLSVSLHTKDVTCIVKVQDHGPGMDQEIIGYLHSGDTVEIVEKYGDWYKVNFNGKTGYAHGKYLNVTDSAEDSSMFSEDALKLFLDLMQSGMSSEDETESSTALTPEGNMTLVDDIGEEEDKSSQQFITLVTKAGNTFYLIIDRDKDGNQNVHFLNMVDEADLLALMDEEEAAKYQEKEPEVTEPAETEKPQETEPAPEEQKTESEQKKASPLPMIMLLLFVIGAAGVGGYLYIKMKGVKPASKKNQPDPDADYHDEDEDALQLPEDDGDEDEEVDVNEDYEAESDDEPV